MTIGAVINTSTLTATFDGEFNNGFISSPDGSTGLWQTSMMNGNRTLSPNGEQEYDSDSSVGYNPFSVQNGVLNINAEPSSVAGANALGLPYDSGVITTESSFSQLYGYFEIDAKLPAGQGLWPAFWLLPESGEWPPELDVFEVLGNDPSTLYFSTHSSDQPSATTTLNTVNTSSGFNLYGVMWGPQTVDLYINNVEVASMPTPADMNVPMYMLANLAVGGSWPGDPNSSTPFPADMQVAYIKAFAYPGTTGGTLYDTLPSQNIGAAPTAPAITAPGSIAAASGVTTSIGGVSVAANWPGGDFTVTLSDYSGLLQTAATNDVLASGEDTTTVTLTGHLASINAALATLTYHGTPTGPDYLWVGANDPQGQQGTASVVVNVGTNAAPVVTTPASLSATAGASQALTGIGVSDSQAGGSVTLVLSDAAGLLATSTATGVTAQGENTKSLTLTGSLAALNADLASLTYQAGAAAGTDKVNVAFSDAAGNHASGSVAVTVAASTTGGITGTPVVTVPASLAATAGTTQSVSGVSVADSTPTGSFTVVLSDSTGLLSTSAETGVTEQGEGTSKVTLTGALAAINTDLATLTYQAGAAAGTDTLTVAASGNGTTGSSHAAVVVNAATSSAAPVVTTPATATVSAAASLAMGGVSIADSTTGSQTVVVSDSNGLLHTAAQTGLTEVGEGTTSLTLTGSLAAINADLTSLTYQAAATTGTDWLWVSANAANAPQGLNHTVVTVAPAAVAPTISLPANFSAPAGTMKALPGISVADSQAGVTVTVVLADKSGLLNTGAQTGVTRQGEGTTTLTLAGSVAAINADLATLTYQGVAAGSDALVVTATANGAEDPSTVAITVTGAPTPVVTMPTSAYIPATTVSILPGVSVADSAGGNMSVTVSDSYGLLHTNAVTGVASQGENTSSLTLTGSLAAINAGLATLIYHAAAATGPDWLWVSANAAAAPQALSHTVVNVAQLPVMPLGGLQTGAGVTVVDRQSSIQGALQIDGGHLLENTGTMTWNTGSIALGSGDTTTTNHTGTLDNTSTGLFNITAGGSINSAGTTGSGTLINAGTMLKSIGAGVTTVFAALNNTGVVRVNTGSLVFEQAVTGSGTLEIGGLARLDFASVVGSGSTMSFLQPLGILEDQATGTFGATIEGFAAGATIDAAALVPGVGTTLTLATGATTDTLTIAGGGHSAIFNLQGSYNASGFHMLADGHGGTDITYSG